MVDHSCARATKLGSLTPHQPSSAPGPSIGPKPHSPYLTLPCSYTFAPQDVVGIIDTSDNTLSTVATGDTDSTGHKFHFGAAIGNTVYFAPRSWGSVGVLALPASAGDDPIFAGADGKVWRVYSQPLPHALAFSPLRAPTLSHASLSPHTLRSTRCSERWVPPST